MAGSGRVRMAIVVNPVAGIGGPAGLAGSDGADVQRRARDRGFRSHAVERAELFLATLAAATSGVAVVVTGDGPLGRDTLRAAGTPLDDVEVVPRVSTGAGTTSADTRAVVARALDRDAELVVFVGGDGTARDVADEVAATRTGVPIAVLGIPAGVKMHSAVFARSAASAARLVADWDPARDGTVLRDVSDIDEDARRRGTVLARLHGALPVPNRPRLLQGGKLGSARTDGASVAALAAALDRCLDPAAVWVLGPGSTIHAACAELDPELGLAATTLLGVDVSAPGPSGRELRRDCNAAEITAMTRGRRVQIVLSPIGGQGFLLGRGNQQIGQELLARTGRDGLVVIATPLKLGELRGGPVYVDSGSPEIDRALAGYVRVHTGPSESAMVRVEAA